MGRSEERVKTGVGEGEEGGMLTGEHAVARLAELVNTPFG